MLTIALVFTLVSLAYFTDNLKVSHEEGYVAKVTVQSSMTDTLDIVAPGDVLELELLVENTGTVEGYVRNTYVITSDGETFDNSENHFKIRVNGVQLTNGLNEYGDEQFTLSSQGSSVRQVEVEVSGDIQNVIQDKDLKLEVLTEIAQVKHNESLDWVELGTSYITLGKHGAYPTVPGN